VRGEPLGAMYRPPNAAANASFLETLRLMLVGETGKGLELAYATARPWLRAGKRIRVEGVPTSFGPVSYTIERLGDSVRIRLEAPPRARTLRLRLRLPHSERITNVRPFGRVD